MAAPNHKEPPMRPVEPSPFDTLEETFHLLVTGPSPLSLNGATIGHGLPSRAIPLDELRGLLLHPSVPFTARDAALNVLVRRAQGHRDGALVGLAGVLLPGLRRAVAPLVQACPAKAADLEAEMLAALVQSVAEARPGAERVAARLVWSAARRARALLGAEFAHRNHSASAPTSGEPPRPWGHPDLVLAEAVAEDVVSADDAELIGATRVGEVPLRQLAAEWGVAYDALQKRRRRAELRLVDWILRNSLSANWPETPVLGVRVHPGRAARAPAARGCAATGATKEVRKTHRRSRPSRGGPVQSSRTSERGTR